MSSKCCHPLDWAESQNLVGVAASLEPQTSPVLGRCSVAAHGNRSSSGADVPALVSSGAGTAAGPSDAVPAAAGAASPRTPAVDMGLGCKRTAVAAADSDASGGARKPQSETALGSYIALDMDYIAAASAEMTAAGGAWRTCSSCCRTAAACVAYSAAHVQGQIPRAVLARRRMDTVGDAGNSSRTHAKNAKCSNNPRYRYNHV